ncbi:MAG: D-2-hydroxyacid dehydrogenase [Acidobacteriia bacterium]|nr:D-2-hydroxyacid dehydrogenase [Terriglobia bacterium]
MAEHNVSRRAFVTLAGGVAAVPAAAAAGRKAVVAPAAINMAAPQAQGDPIRIVTSYRFAPNEIRQIEQAAAPTKVDIVHCRDRDEFKRRLPEAEVIYGGLRQGELDSAPKVQWIMNGGAGVERMPQDLRDHPVAFTNYARTFAPGISETAMGLLLALTRRIHTYMKQFYVDKELKPLGTPKTSHHGELAGRVMGVVGLGGIGEAIARRAYYGFDMRIVGTDAKPIPKPHFVDELHDPTWFDEMVPQVDVLVSAVPHTPLTERMFNADVFRSMKETAYFICMSRGMVFDDMALVKALKEGWIAGAGLDVFAPDPAPKGHPIYELDNVVMTPHTSGWSLDRQVRLINLFSENIHRYARGQPLINVVDKQAGY